MPRKPPTFRLRRIDRPRPPDARPTSYRRGYDGHWQRLRAVVLSGEPLCRPCRQAGRTTAAEHVDHDTPLTAGGTNDASNLVPMCQPCHSAKTVARDGGFGHRPRRR